MVRSGGVPLSAEELVGVLDGLTTSMRAAADEDVETARPAAASTGGRRHRHPSPFSELLAGLETVGAR